MLGTLNRLKNRTQQLLNTSILSDPSRPVSERSLATRFADGARAVMYSHHAIMDTIIKRAPKSAQPMLQSMLDRVAAAPGERRYTGETFEERKNNLADGWIRRFSNVITSAGYKRIEEMGNEESDMLRHALTTEENSYPLDPNDVSRTGPSKPIPENILTAAGRLRPILDEVWRASHDAGLDIGYAKSGYYPRIYDALKATASAESKTRFLQQASKLHSLMFDQELGDPGSDPVALLEKWTTLAKEEKESTPNGSGDQATLAGHMQALQKNLRRQAEIEAELNDPQSTADPDALAAEQDQLKAEAEQIAQDAHPLLRDHVSALAANNWLVRLMDSGMHEFDNAGPSGKYLQARTLPPEADQIMREFMRTNPADALPNYFNSAARRVSLAERFGTNGEDLKAVMAKVKLIPEMNTYDANWFHQQMDAVLGQNNTHSMPGLMRISNMIHAAGSMMLMPRSAWSSLAEPMNAALATSDMKTALNIFAGQFGQIFKTASAKERTEMAEYIGTVTGAMHDSVMLARMGADYSDSPALNRFMTQYYRITGQTQLTNSQRIAATAASHGLLAKFARDYQNAGTDRSSQNGRDNATAWFRELGLNDPIHGDFAKWMTDFKGGRPSVADLKTDPMAGAYSLATRRLVDRMIQKTYKVDRAAASSVPFVGLAFQLMSFNYQFQRNVLEPAMERVLHARTRAMQQATAEGSGKFSAQLQGGLAATGSAVHAATMAGAMVAAGVITTAMRQWLFAPDQWDKHAEAGDLAGYITDLAMQRSGLNGTLDPIIQIGTNLRYDANVSTLLEGASINWMARNLQDILTPLGTANDSPNTNTRYFNAARGAFNLVAVPAAAFGLTKLGAIGGAIGGKLGALTTAGAGAALQYGTSPATANAVAEAATGPKGATLPKPGGSLQKLSGLQGLKGLQTLGGGRQAGKGEGATEDAKGGLFPWAIADDVAKPAWQIAGEPVTSAIARLPGPVKVLGGLGAAAYGAKSFLDTTAPWRGQPPPKPKEHRYGAATP